VLCSIDLPVRPQAKAPGPTPDGGLVLELLRAAIHSRAAYGYAMQAGHVSSVLNFALMHAVHSFRCGCEVFRPLMHGLTTALSRGRPAMPC